MLQTTTGKQQVNSRYAADFCRFEPDRLSILRKCANYPGRVGDMRNVNAHVANSTRPILAKEEGIPDGFSIAEKQNKQGEIEKFD